MSFALPESMRAYIDNRPRTGNHGSTSEYICDLVRRDQEEQANKRQRDLIEVGLASGPGRRRTKEDEKELLAIARGEIDGRQQFFGRKRCGTRKVKRVAAAAKPGPGWQRGW